MFLQERKLFYIMLPVLGFLTKIVAEFIHEVLGHGLFVLLLGGEIADLRISVLWPYEFSHIRWFWPDAVSPVQQAWAYAGGILVCLAVSFLIQAFLIVKRKLRWHYSLMFFWLAFWMFISSAGYLLIGGFAPFGDVYNLIELGVLTRHSSFLIGIVVFIIGFVALSLILRRTLTGFYSFRMGSLGVSVFWLIVPLLFIAVVASPEHILQTMYLPLAFLPSLLSFIMEFKLVLAKQKANAAPDNVSSK